MRDNLLICDWQHFVGQNHFYVMLPFDQRCHLYSESSFQKCASQSSKKILCSFQVRRNPRFLPNGSVMHPETHQCLLFKLASVKTFQQHILTLFRVQEESSIQVHPSKQCSNTVQTLVSVWQVKGFPSQSQYGKTTATVRMSSLHRSDAILDKAKEVEKNYNRPDVRATPFEC